MDYHLWCLLMSDALAVPWVKGTSHYQQDSAINLSTTVPPKLKRAISTSFVELFIRPFMKTSNRVWNGIEEPF